MRPLGIEVRLYGSFSQARRIAKSELCIPTGVELGHTLAH
jgi:hypothetical protein